MRPARGTGSLKVEADERWPDPGATWVGWGTHGRPTLGSVGVVAAMFGGWGLAAGLAGSGFAPPVVLVCLWGGPLVAASAIWWFERRSGRGVTGEERRLLLRTTLRRLDWCGLLACPLLVVAINSASVASVVAWVAAGIVLAAILALARARWQGGVSVQWDTERLATGSRVRLFVGTSAGSGRLDRPRVLLRCVRVGARGRTDFSRRKWGVAWETRWSAPAGLSPGPEEPVIVEFDLPAGLPPARIAEEPLVFWELVIRGDTSWGRVTESFLLPVRGGGDVARPGGAPSVP